MSMFKKQDKSSDIEQKPPFGKNKALLIKIRGCKISNIANNLYVKTLVYL